MELRAFYSPLSAGNALYPIRRHMCWSKRCYTNGIDTLEKTVKPLRAYFPRRKRSFVYCSNNPEMNHLLPSELELLDSKVIYSVAAAMGHNKVAHPECNARVPAIINALEKMKLTSESRSTEIIKLEDFRPAKVEDIASVHERAYVSELEKVMDQAAEQGLIHIEGSGPTYATSTTFHESLLAAGAGISLVDAVVMSRSKT